MFTFNQKLFFVPELTAGGLGSRRQTISYWGAEQFMFILCVNSDLCFVLCCM